MKREVRILITGGGTGGHVGPALAVVQRLREMSLLPDADFAPVFCYMGSEQGVEASMAREASLPFVGVSTGKFRRFSNPKRFFEFLLPNIGDALRQPVGVWEAVQAVRKFAPDVTLSTGGYVSVPPVLASWLLKVPVLAHEQTVTIGLANRINARFATRFALTFDGAEKELPKDLQAKTFVSGNPVRNAIFDGDRERAARRFGFAASDDGIPCLYVTGGAQGASVINRAMASVLSEVLTLPCRIVHQCGKQPDDWEQDFDLLTKTANALPIEQQRRFFVTRFVSAGEIGAVYALSDVVVSRSGAGTVTEICALGKPALFIPKVPAGGDEQTKNARRLADAGAAVVLAQKDCDGPHLFATIQSLLIDPAKLAKMGQAAHGFARPRAADTLAETLLQLARRK